ncbi:HU family DNA-binding protein [Bacteroides sp. GD17]|jgi:predicted histone-like DNA-binding protein|uniref:HU family DNA-binding protein n=1 Tax=Bacteroides sp. GD17 TaxID=3139826 RepID=UPI0025E90C50|nr:HU family DNA-binding protein [uncultured Bacteroides sp.]
MGVPFKKIARKDPRKADAVAKYYPQLVTLGDNATLDDLAYVMKEKSSLTLGDIQSVLTNFVEAMITTLYNGQSVNVKNFGVFSLSARTAGVLDVKECTAKNIKAVKINFRPSSTVRPDITATRAGQKIDFYDLESLVNKGEGGSSSGGGSDDNKPGGGGSDGDQGENPLG